MTSHPLLKGDIKLREYQESAVAVALDQNTLVVLPTGLGKTIIGLFLAAHRLHKVPKSKILFLAPTKPLIQQHIESFKEHLKLEEDEFALLTGTIPANKRKEMWSNSRAIFATPQTIENDLISDNINLNDVSLIVFDEAHRAVGEYAYVFIAKKYAQQGKNQVSLALTASPGSSKEKINEIVKNLNIKDVEIKSDKDHDVKPYVQKMQADWIKVEFPENFKRLRGLLKGCMNDYMDFLKVKGYLQGKTLKNLGKRDLLTLQSDLREAMTEGEPDWDAISESAALMKIQHAMELLETQGMTSLHEYFKRMKSQKSKAVAVLLKREDVNQAIGLAEILHNQGIDHPKLLKLKELVHEQLEKKRLSKTIIFTQYRDSVEKILSTLDGEKGIAASKLIGQAVKGKQKGMTQKEQKEILREFNENLTNVLVATSVHPDEFIALKSPSGAIVIKSIGEFVDSFLEVPKKELNNSRKIKGWKALSTDGKRVDFYPITEVHRHLRRSDVVDVRLNNGFSIWVTKDHSLFTFDEKGGLKASEPHKDMFVNLGFSAPNDEHLERIDVVKELVEHAPKEVLNKVFCSFDGLTQAKMRELSTDYKILSKLGQMTLSVGEIAEMCEIALGTVTRSTGRMQKRGLIKKFENSRYSFRSISKGGEEYLAFLKWFFRYEYYHKRKYRMSIKDAAKAPKGAENFCELNVGVWYGKGTVPRFMNMNEDLAEFLGWYVAEGASKCTKYSSDVYLAARNKDIQKRMARSIKGGLLLKPNVSWRGVAADAQIAHHLIKYVFRCGVGAYNKEVPSSIFSSSNKCKWRFLEAYTLGDGYVTEKRVVWTTVSRKLATGLILLSRQLGIKKITLRRDHAYRVGINEPLPFADMQENAGKRGYYDTTPNALLSKRDFEKYENYFKSVPGMGGSCRRALNPNSETCFDYIKSMKNVEKQPEYVYDISVKGTERFMGGVGLVTLHNSVGEEGLDIDEVDLVIFYEPVPSEIRTIQRRGRTARKKSGRLVILMTTGTRDEVYYWAAFHKERKMRAAIKEVKRDFKGEQSETPGQSSLKTFIQNNKEEDKLYVYVDHRERNSGIAKKLSEMGVTVDVKQMQVADFLVSEKVCIERKTIKDFLQSLIDGRLMTQMSEMARNFENPILMIEGDPATMYTERNINPNAIRGAIASIAVNFGIPLIYTTGPEDTAAFVYTLAKREQEGTTKEIALRGEKRAMSLNEWQRFIVESFPNVSSVLAKRLLKHFGSVEAVLLAQEKELQEVEGVGDKKAKRIREIIREKYEE